MGLGGIVVDGLDGKVRVGVFVCTKGGMWWRGMFVDGRIDINTCKFC